ncbi:MAG: hypothetical protein ACIARQ_10780 [Phycisphaerales bacterium JB061]
MIHPAKTRSTTPTRRGTIYILVLMTSIIITLIGILGFRMVESQARVARIDAQRDNAAALAESAVQWGIHYVMLADDWRDSVNSSETIRTMTVGDGQISVLLFDPDGDLADEETDAVTIVGTGTIGDASQSYAVTLQPGTDGSHPSLEKSITAGGMLTVNPNVLWLESGGTAQDQQRRDGRNHSTPVVDEQDPVDLPNPGLVDIWAAKGTLIPRSTHGGNISSKTFSKSQAPYGLTPDPNGIYVINAEGHDVMMSNCSTSGTIVVVNLGSRDFRATSSKFTMGDHGGPSLIVDGDGVLELGAFSGMSDGIFYFSDDVYINNYLFLIGVLIAGDRVDVNTSSVIISDSAAAVAGPPEGFNDVTPLRVVEGSWLRIVN